MNKNVHAHGELFSLELAADLSVINVDGVGPVRINHSRRARRVIISVSPTIGVKVSVPYRTSVTKALEFVETKKDGFKNTRR